MTLPITVRSKEAQEGDAVSFVCEPPAGELNVKFAWYSLANGTRTEIVNNTSGESTLNLARVTCPMNGLVYECIATSGNGIVGRGSGNLTVNNGKQSKICYY